MNQSPLSLFFRFLFSGLIVFFLGLLYWSSVLMEEDLKSIKRDLAELKKQPLAPFITTKSPIERQPQKFHPLNLLSADPFIETTLPKLLGSHFEPSGERKENRLGKPDNLYPFSEWYDVATWNGMCTVPLVNQEVGRYETYVPAMATNMELKTTVQGKPEYWMTLRKDVFWAPLNPRHFSNDMELAPHFLKKHQVNAHDFKFYYDAIMNPNVEEELAVTFRGIFNDIEEIRVEDDFTLVVRWKTKTIRVDGKEEERMRYASKLLTGSLRPLARFVYQYFADGTKIIEDDSDPETYRKNSIWAQNFAHHWASTIIPSCGPWLFNGMSEREIRFSRNPDYFQPLDVLVNAYDIKFTDSQDSIWNNFKRGNIDLFTIPPHQLPELENFLKSEPYLKQKENHQAIQRLDYLQPRYAFVAWNETKPQFNNAKIRRALTMAIDRERIIRQNLHGMGIQTTGTFFPLSPSYDKSIIPYPFDPDEAKKILEEEGWSDRTGTGILDKMINGKTIPFQFTLTYFVKNPTTKSVSEYISTALKEIGVQCDLKGVDVADLSSIFENKEFDAFILEWSLGTPPEDPRQLWHSEGAKMKGSSNAIGFSNSEIDQIIDALDYEYDTKKREELYHRFDKILHEEAPYTFLYTPKTSIIYREFLQNVFIPADRQDLMPGANVGEPQPSLYWIKQTN